MPLYGIWVTETVVKETRYLIYQENEKMAIEKVLDGVYDAIDKSVIVGEEKILTGCSSSLRPGDD